MMQPSDKRLITEARHNTDLAGKQSIIAKGQPNGYPSLDSNAKIPLTHIPDGIGSGFKWRGAWAPSTLYKVNDVFSANSQLYIVKTEHTSGAGAPSVSGPWTNIDLYLPKAEAGTGGSTAPAGTVPVYEVTRDVNGNWPGGTANTWTRPTADLTVRFRLVGVPPFPTAVASGTGGPIIGHDYVSIREQV